MRQNRSFYTAGVNLNYRNNANDLWDLLQKQGQLQEKIGSATFISIPKESCGSDLESFCDYFRRIVTETTLYRFLFS